MMSGCGRPLAVVAEPGRQAATYTYRKEQAIRIVALSLKLTLPTKVTCAACAEKCMIFVFCFRELKLRHTPSPPQPKNSPHRAYTGIKSDPLTGKA
jgi:hypothetical protein